MNRTEFLAALALRLEDLPEEERDEAVKYYSEYLDEVGPDGEDNAINELGGAEKVSNIIRANCGLGPYRPVEKHAEKPQLTLDSPTYSAAAERTIQTAQAAAQPGPTAPAADADAQSSQTADAAQPAPGAAKATGPVPPVYRVQSPFNTQAPDGRGVYRAAAEAGAQAADVPTGGAPVPPTYSTQPQAPLNAGNNRVLWLILIIVTFPIWIGILGGLFGLIMGILGALFGLVMSGLGVFIGGILHCIAAIPLFATSPVSALATVGMSLLLAGGGALLFGGMLAACGKLIPWLWKCALGLLGWLRGKVSGNNV